jgi:IS30 family transposase
LVSGSGNSHIGTLVERSGRVVPLVKLENKTTDCVTWDRGLEMAKHEHFTVDTGVQVYFCDPKNPWQ